MKTPQGDLSTASEAVALTLLAEGRHPTPEVIAAQMTVIRAGYSLRALLSSNEEAILIYAPELEADVIALNTRPRKDLPLLADDPDREKLDALTDLVSHWADSSFDSVVSVPRTQWDYVVSIAGLQVKRNIIVITFDRERLASTLQWGFVLRAVDEGFAIAPAA